MSVSLLSEPADRLPEAVAAFVRQRSEAVGWLALGQRCLELLGRTSPDEPPDENEVTRALAATGPIGDALAGVFGSAVLRGFQAYRDTTTAWTYEQPAANFKQSELFVVASGNRFKAIPRGGTAAECDWEVAKTPYALKRFGRRLEIDERDIFSDRPISLTTFLAEALGAEAARLRPDLVYSLVLRNPGMVYDSTALFHTDHSNLSTAAFGGPSLADAIAAIGNQTLDGSDGNPVHLNNAARVLVVPPDLTASARTAVRDLILRDSRDLTVEEESRLSAVGVFDQATDTLRNGSATNWLLAGAGVTLPSIVVLALNGRFQPETRTTQLDQGKWGVGFDISLDLAAVAVDHRGVYWSSGDA